MRARQLGIASEQISRLLCSQGYRSAVFCDAVFEALGNHQTEVALPDPDQTVNDRSHLGLSLDGDILTRRGYSARISVSKMLSVGLLHRPIRAGDRRTTLAEARDEWEELGGNSADPESVTVRAEISHLRRIVEQLDVTIPRPPRNLGWKLEPEKNARGV
jgi:hypothetical protein